MELQISSLRYPAPPSNMHPPLETTFTDDLPAIKFTNNFVSQIDNELFDKINLHNENMFKYLIIQKYQLNSNSHVRTTSEIF